MFFLTIFGFLILLDAVTMFRNEKSMRKKLLEIRQWKR